MTTTNTIAGAIGLIAGIVVYFIRLPVMLRRHSDNTYKTCRIYAVF